MKKFEFNIYLLIEAENEEEVWQKFKDAKLHETLNQLDAEGSYQAEIEGVQK